jgi:hypothetical protein
VTHEKYSSDCFSVSNGLSPIARPGSFPRQINLTFGRRAKPAVTKIPAYDGWGLRRTRPFSKAAFWAMGSRGSSTPGSAKTDDGPGRFGKIRSTVESSGRLHGGSFDDDAGGHIFPQRHQQFPGQSHDDHFLKTTAVTHHSLLKPQSQRRLRLVAQP